MSRFIFVSIMISGLLFITCKTEEPPATEMPQIAKAILGSKIIDLTHPFNEDAIFWPTEERGFVMEEIFRGHTEHFYYAAYRWSGADHGGTHWDAPIHFYEGGRETHEVPIEELIGPGIVVDVTEQAATDRDYRVQVSDFEAWEAVHGRIPDGAILILRTGWGQYYHDREAYLGTAELGEEAVKDLSFPGLHHEAAEWLVKNRTIKTIGLDTPSIDYGQSTKFKSHVVLCSAQIPILENVARAEELPATGFTIIALPMLIEGASGGPARIIAVIE